MSVVTSPRTVLILDGTNILYRSHHALARSGLTHLSRPVWAVHGLLSTAARLLRDYPCHGLAFAFDSQGGCPSRRALQPAYKETRTPPELDLAYQLEWAPSLVRECGLHAWTASGWEADDGLASLASSATAEGVTAFVASSDRDTYQLASSSVSILLPDGTRVDDSACLAKYGVSLAGYPHMAALRGEPSDNLPGIPGVGNKTAAALVSRFGTLEGVLTASDADLRSVVSARIVGLIREHAATSRLTFEVARLRTDLPVDLEAAWFTPDSAASTRAACDASGLPAAGASLAQALSRFSPG